MTSKVIEVYKSSSNFSVNPTLEPILIKIYMTANNMNTQIFYLYKYDLKVH